MAERTASPNAERDYHMELRDLLGEDYREGMTAEEKMLFRRLLLQILENLE